MEGILVQTEKMIQLLINLFVIYIGIGFTIAAIVLQDPEERESS